MTATTATTTDTTVINHFINGAETPGEGERTTRVQPGHRCRVR
jgi:hypothetical protein